MLGGLKKKNTTQLCLQETHFHSNDTHRLKSEMIDDIQSKEKQKGGQSHNYIRHINFKPKKVTRVKEDH